MRGRSLAICARHMYALELAVRMAKVLVEQQGIIQISFIGRLTLPLKHRQLGEQIIECFLIVHCVSNWLAKVKKSPLRYSQIVNHFL